MQSVSSVSTPAPDASKPADPVVAGGAHAAVGDMLRSASDGYQTAASQLAVQSDKAAIYPFEAVTTLTGLLRDRTAAIKGLNKATSMLHTIGGMAMLIMANTVSSTLRAPGDTAHDVAYRVADAIDGRKTASGWNLGWGVTTPQSTESTTSSNPIEAALLDAGVR